MYPDVNNLHVAHLRGDFRLPKCVNDNNRHFQDIPMALGFVIVFLSHLVLGAYIFSVATSSNDRANQLASCLTSTSNQTMLTYSSTAVIHGSLDTIGDLMSDYPKLVASCWGFIIFLSLLWVFLLKYCTTLCCYVTWAFNVLIVAGLGVYYYTLEAVATAVFFWLWACLYLCFLSIRYESMRDVVHVFEVASTALIKNPSLMFSSLGLCLVMCIYMIFVFFVNSSSFLVGSYDLIACEWQNTWYTYWLRAYLSFTWVWMLTTIDFANLFCVSHSVAGWYFGSEASTCASLTLAFGQSLGTVSHAGFVVALIEALNELSGEKNPFSFCLCCLKCIVLIVKSCCEFVTRFAVIIAALTGGNFKSSADIAYGVMNRHFANGLSANVTGVEMAAGFARYCSLAVGLFAWIWVDQARGLDPFEQGDIFALFPNKSWRGFLVVVGVVWVLILFYYRSLGLFIATVSPKSLIYFFGVGFTFGFFVALMASYMFSFLAYTVLYSADAVMLCYCIDQDSAELAKSQAGLVGGAMRYFPGYKLGGSSAHVQMQIVPSHVQHVPQVVVLQPVVHVMTPQQTLHIPQQTNAIFHSPQQSIQPAYNSNINQPYFGSVNQYAPSAH